MVCPSASSVTFTNTSYNGTFTSVEWKFAGGTPSVSTVSNPVVSYSIPGSYNVELKVKNGIDSSTIVKQNYINVQSTTGAGLPYSEGFETVTSLNGTEWFTNNLDTSNTWKLTNLVASSGSTSIMIDNYASTINGKDELYSRAINLTGATGLSIYFKYAFARRDTSNKDQLQLYGVSACNGTAIQRYNAIGAALETTTLKTNPYYPTSASEWRSVSTLMLVSQFTSGFRLKFVFSKNGGNNIFIDDINIDITTDTKDIAEIVNYVNVYPNPASDLCSIKFIASQTKTLFIDVFNVLGEKVYSIQKGIYDEGEHEVKLNTTNLPNGMYIVQLSDGARAINKQLVISK
jgi:PKD repeat protein